MAEETLRVLETGVYVSPSGRNVDISHAIDAAVAGAKLYRPSDEIRWVASAEARSEITVANESTLEAMRRIAASGRSVVALNFASAHRPGGGFIAGAQAQEEALARSSALYATIVGSEMYAANRAVDAIYTDHLIYSPAVPVFRDDSGAFLEEPYLSSFITCPAVNAGAVLECDADRLPEIRDAMGRRIKRVLAVAAKYGHSEIVLGAFGCGVFRNDPSEVAELFWHQLSTTFDGIFSVVHFAVLDQPGGHNIESFVARFGSD
ncbi:TIGR02452 family protein [bacterium]|nr:TIGR02452 family protein [bacterium]